MKVYANGSCVWFREYQLSVTHCPMDVTWFPFDEQRCDIVFESKVHDSKELNVTDIPSTEDGRLSMYETNGEWELVGKA